LKNLRSAKLLVLVILGAISLSSRAQLIVNRNAPNNNSIAYLVQHILLGNGVTVSNITYSGDDTAFGFFNGLNSSINLDSGIILTNGMATDACGPNNNSATTYSWPHCHQFSDPDLAAIAGVSVTSVAKIEFDFIPYADTIKFKYVFGSEEYPEFVNSFNDAFGFFVSGPGINGPYTNNAENIALIPGTTNTPVTIDSVNCTVHSGYYVCNWPSTPCNVGCPTNAQLPTTTVQYDGYTVPLTAIAAVECGQQYHIKIAICNASDCDLESGVFLESGSFSSTGATVSRSVGLNHTYYPGDSILYRGACGSASLLIERGSSTIADTIVIDTAGTATPGVDYTPLPDTVILPVGVTGDTINISAFPSAKTGLQTLVVSMIQRLCSQPDTQKVTIYIGNPPPIVINEPTQIACFNGSVSLTPAVSGGVGTGGYLYNWSTGSTASSDTVHNITTDTSFVVHVKDLCGDSATDTVHITMETPMHLTITNDTTLFCPHDTVTLTTVVTGGKPGYIYSWNVAGSSSSIKVVAPVTKLYKVTVTDTCGLTAQDSMTVTISTTPLVISISHDTSIQCSGTVHPVVTASGGGGVYSYTWSTGSTTSSTTPIANKDTAYIVSVHCSCGNQTQTDTVRVTVLPVTFHVTVSDDTTICAGQSVTLSVTGGNSYLWSTPSTNSSINVTPPISKTYSVSAFIGNCRKDTTVTVNVTPIPVVTVTPNQTICQGDSATLDASGANTYVWSDGKTGSAIRVTPLVPTTYTVIGSDGCPDTNSTFVNVKIPIVDICCDTSIKKGSSIGLSVLSGATSYTWQPATGLSCTDCATPIASPSVTTIYTVTALDTDGCPITKTVKITIDNLCADFEVPTVFTPNNDGINDDFVINILNPTAYNITIFDRWGKQVFTSSTPTEYWNGRLNGTDNLVPDGVYYYNLKADCGSNEYIKKGFVEVLGEK